VDLLLLLQSIEGKSKHRMSQKSASDHSLIESYAWMEMDKYAILREMKRLELQVMSVSGKLNE